MKRRQTPHNWQAEGCQNYDNAQDICLDDEVVDGDEVDAGHFMNLSPEGNARGRVKERKRVDNLKWLEDAVLQAAKDMYANWKRRGSGPEPSLTTSLLRDLAIEGTGGVPEDIKWMSKRQQDLAVLNVLQKLKRKGLMESSTGMGQRGGDAKVWNPVSASTDPVKTARGTPIKRYKNLVGKLVGPQLYVHKKYAPEVIPAEKLEAANQVFDERGAFPYNSVMFDSKKDVVRFDEAPDFDTAREPRVGRYLAVDLGTGAFKEGKSDSIWHHKWLWVKDDYSGFDVNASREWSRKWASAMPEVAKGTERTFAEQLKKHNIAALLMAVADYFDPEGEVSASTYNAKARYKALNDKLFDDKLPDIPVTMRNLKHVGGKATAKVLRNASGKRELVPGSIKITLDSTFKRTTEQFDAVLVHEMIHVYNYVQGDFDEQHGPTFEAMAKKLGDLLGVTIPLTDETKNLEFEEDAAAKPVGVVMMLTSGDQWVYGLMNEKVLRRDLQHLANRRATGGPMLIGVTTDPFWVRKAKSMAEQRSIKLSLYYLKDTEKKAALDGLTSGEVLLDQTQQQKVAADFKRPHDAWKNLKPGIQPLPQPLEGHEKAWAKIATRLGIDGARGVMQLAPVIGGRRRYHHRPLTSWLLPDKKTTLTLTSDKLEGQSWNRLKNKRHIAMPRVYDVFELRLTGVKEPLWAIVHERLTWPVDPDWDLFVDTFFRWRAMQKDALKPAQPGDLTDFLRFLIDPAKSDPVTVQRRRVETALPFKMMNDRRADIAARRRAVWKDRGLQQKIAWAKSTLKFLRENKIKHRDLDPSNLAKTLKGRTVVTNVAESRSKGHKIGRLGRVSSAVPPVKHDPFGPTSAPSALTTAQAVNFLLDPEAPLMEQLQILSAETRLLVNTIHNDPDMRAAVQEAAFKVGFPQEMLLAGLEKLAALAEKSGGKSVYIAEACMNKLGKGIAMNPPLPMMGAVQRPKIQKFAIRSVTPGREPGSFVVDVDLEAGGYATVRMYPLRGGGFSFQSTSPLGAKQELLLEKAVSKLSASSEGWVVVKAAGWRRVKTPEQRSQAAQKAAQTRKARQVPVEVKINGIPVAGAYYPAYNGKVDEAHIYFKSRKALKRLADLPMVRAYRYTDDYSYDNDVNFGKGKKATLAEVLPGSTTVGLSLDKPGSRYDGRVGWFLHVGSYHIEAWDSAEPVEVQVRKTEVPAPVELPPMPTKMAASTNYYKKKRHQRRVGKMQKIIDSLVEDPDAEAEATNDEIVASLRAAADYLDPK